MIAVKIQLDPLNSPNQNLRDSPIETQLNKWAIGLFENNWFPGQSAIGAVYIKEGNIDIYS